MSWSYLGNQTNVNGDLKCPGCPVTSAIGQPCVHGTLQQEICVPSVQFAAADDPILYRPRNVVAYQTHSIITPVYPTYYVDGDEEAHDPLIGPGVGDPDFTGPYE